MSERELGSRPALAEDDELPEWSDDAWDRAEYSVAGIVRRAATGTMSRAGTNAERNRYGNVVNSGRLAVAGGKRTLINTGTDKRYVRRDSAGRFTESDDVGKSLSQDVRKHAKTEVKSGQGDRGDQKRKK